MAVSAVSQEVCQEVVNSLNLVSVIVPVYKAEQYLPKCLDSILSSTYKELEIILIDDGSPDDCPAICDRYACSDPRIKVIHQENQGPAAARNAGLAMATGTYVSFVDSDDAISPILYEMMVSAMERTGADMAACEASNSEEHLVLQVNPEAVIDRCLDSFDQQLAMLTNAPSVRTFTWTSCYLWDKLYRRVNIHFPFLTQCIIGEDLEFNWKYIHTCAKTVMVPYALYLYRLNQQGITGTYKSQRRNPKMIANGITNAKQWATIAQHSDIHDKELQNYLNARSAYVAHGALWRIYAAKQEQNYKTYCAEARRLLKEYCNLVLRDRTTYSLPLRTMCVLCGNCFPLWKTIARVYGML